VAIWSYLSGQKSLIYKDETESIPSTPNSGLLPVRIIYHGNDE